MTLLPILFKMRGSYVVILFTQTPILVCLSYMARFRVKNGHQTKMCYDEIGTRALEIDIVIGLVVNIIKRVYAIT